MQRSISHRQPHSPRIVSWLLAGCSLLVLADSNALEPSASVQIKELLKTTQTWAGGPIRYPEGQAEITGLLIEIAPGAQTGWHQHPTPSFGIVLEGALEVRLASGAMKRVNAGEALAEVIDTAHNGRNAGTTPVKLLIFYAGTKGAPLSVPSTASSGNDDSG